MNMSQEKTQKAWYHVAKATRHYVQGCDDDALRELAKAENADPNAKGIYELRYRIHDNHRDREGAIWDLTELLRLSEYDEERKFCSTVKSLLCMALGRDEQAIKTLNTAIARDPSYEIWYQIRSIVYCLMGDFVNAEADIRRIVTMERSDDTTRLKRADLVRIIRDNLEWTDANTNGALVYRAYSLMLNAVKAEESERADAVAGSTNQEPT